MSGGEQQMCAMGRALMARPSLLLLDEPSLGLAPIFVDRYFDDIFIQHDTPPERLGQKKDRNIAILRRHVANGATDDRSLYVYAVECLHVY